jgi:membrane-bound metal-dependent hydrolase YbcI (DUF457 family)
MDTITHGIAGALIGKALFRGEDMLAISPMNRARIVTWSLMLGAIFPDADTLREMFSKNELLMITWHRSITHSLLVLPLWSLLLAALTLWLARLLEWEAPSFKTLTAIYAVGILSHILLDLVTTFGTMIWSPLEWSRPAWDLIFIVDFTLTGIFLIPQFLAWAYADPAKVKTRAVGMFLVFLPTPLVVAKIAQIVGAPISVRALAVTIAVLAILFLFPAIRRGGLRVSQAAWNRAGLIVACIYILLAVLAHSAALDRVKKFSAFEHLDVQSLGALPFPPSIWNWDGLIRTPHGVYEMRMDLSQKAAPSEPASVNPSDAPALEYRFYPEAPPNSYIEQAKHLPEVQKVLWFSRFPVTRFHKEGDDALVEISDVRFPQIRPGRAAAFTYRVRFGPDGNVLSQGWVTR